MDREIASALFVSRRTAQDHLARIFAKLGVKSQTTAATATLTRGLVSSSLSDPPTPNAPGHNPGP
jgi:DNA-binding NarL/FixJ family response regulator